MAQTRICQGQIIHKQSQLVCDKVHTRCQKLLNIFKFPFMNRDFFMHLNAPIAIKITPLESKILHKKLYYNFINQVISYWPSYRSKVCCIGPRANTADQGPVTGPIRNYLINDNFIN